MRVAVGLEREAPAGAVAQANALLAALAPRSEVLNWLLCYWEPGEAWAPVERLVIAEMTPAAVLHAERGLYRAVGGPQAFSVLDELNGPNPREGGHYDQVRRRFVYDGLPPTITQRQWLLWRAHRAYATPVWVVQGTRGGHARHLSDSAKALLRLHGRTGDVAAPGDLPYAPVDQRTVEALARADRLRRWRATMGRGWTDRGLADVWRARADEEGAFRGELLAWLDAQLDDAAEDAKRVDLADLPRARARDFAALRAGERADQRLRTETPTAADYARDVEGVVDADDYRPGRVVVAA